MNETTFLQDKTPSVPADSSSAYQAVRGGGAGAIDLSSRGRIRVSGSEAVMFLNGLITNDMKTLAENHWMSAAFPNVQGRLIAAVRVIRLPDEASQAKPGPGFLLDTEAATLQQVLKTIGRFTMAGDFQVSDVTGDTAMLSLQGRRALTVTGELLGDSTVDLERDGVRQAKWNGTEMIVIRASHTAEDGFDFIVNVGHLAELSSALIKAGVKFVGDDVFETLRIEAGVGRFGEDMDETNVVTEANLDDAVSFTKGCYIGQEIIARIKYRGHVAKKLSGLTFEGEHIVKGGAVIRSGEGKDIGRITSVTFSPRLARTIALGYVRYEYLAPGTEVIVGENELKAKVTQLPFVRGSWYE
jgi:folate-binding protein YgfZ